MDANATSTTPHLDTVVAEISGLKFLHDPVAGMRGPDYDVWAERHIARLAQHLDGTGLELADGVEAFVAMTFDVIEMQQEFYESGRFSMDIHGGSLYSDEEIMGRRYLLGLYLAQVLWPNHHSKLTFFERELVASVGDGARVLDVGCGPGTYGLTVGRAVRCDELTLLDISPLSEPLVRGLAAVDPVIGPGNADVVVGDFLELPLPSAAYDVVLFSEIVEHLVDPEAGMRRLADITTPHGSVFFSTATNSAFYDHTIVFTDLDEIRDLVARHGFEVAAEHTVVAMPGPEGEDRDVVDYSAVLRRMP